jgi:NAD-dependent deacetylase
MRIVVLTGAGISAESGLPTFRDADGLWEGHRPEQVATPEAYAAEPDLVHRFYDARRAALLTVSHNPAHEALARLERVLGDELTLVTQNIDDLHERAGSTRVHHLHGQLRKARCTRCGTVHRWDGDLVERPPCSACGARGLRPHVVWFGEVPLGMDDVATALEAADLFVSIGTSGSVYPAAGFVQVARAGGAATLELNLVPSEGSAWFDEARHGPASELVPAWVDELTAQVEGR